MARARCRVLRLAYKARLHHDRRILLQRRPPPHRIPVVIGGGDDGTATISQSLLKMPGLRSGPCCPLENPDCNLSVLRIYFFVVCHALRARLARLTMSDAPNTIRVTISTAPVTICCSSGVTPPSPSPF